MKEKASFIDSSDGENHLVEKNILFFTQMWAIFYLQNLH